MRTLWGCATAGLELFHFHAIVCVQVQRFWRVFRELSNDDRSKFIRFAWGRARLPKLEHWTVPFKITRHGGGDTAMPIAHTW